LRIFIFKVNIIPFYFKYYYIHFQILEYFVLKIYWTPLHFACKKGSLEIVQFLVEHKADIANATYYATENEIKRYLQSQ
jgi:hypothetical protein